MRTVAHDFMPARDAIVALPGPGPGPAMRRRAVVRRVAAKPLGTPLERLMALPGALCFWDSSPVTPPSVEFDPTLMTVDATDKVMTWTSRIGGHVLSGGSNRPQWYTDIVNNKSAVKGVIASSSRLVQLNSPIAAALSGDIAYSFLLMWRPAAGAATVKTVWGLGSTTGSGRAEHLQLVTSGTVRHERATTGNVAGSGNVLVSASGVRTLTIGVYNPADAGKFYCWNNNNSANGVGFPSLGRDIAPVNSLQLFARRVTNTFSQFGDQSIWGLIIANKAWSAAERLEAGRAAQLYWGGGLGYSQ